MGNQGSSKQIIILDDLNRPDDFSLPYDASNYTKKYYHLFENFTEQQNIKNIENIIIRSRESSLQQKMKEIDYSNRFVKVCPLLVTSEKSMKDKIIAYLKKLSLSPNVYLIVEDITNFKLPEHDRPYIKKIVMDLDRAIDEIKLENIEKNFKVKLQRMSKDMYRKIMVKVIDTNYISDKTKKSELNEEIKADIKILSDNHISYEYFQSVAKFQKSCISTSNEFLIVKPQLVTEAIDSRMLNFKDYEIILRAPLDIDLPHKKRNKLWLIEPDINNIINKMKICSVIDQEQKPLKSTNTIICGGDQIYTQHFEKIKQKIIEKFSNDKEQYNKMNFHFIKPQASLQQMLSILKESIYSYMVVFEPSEYLKDIKRSLKYENFDNRVQLTNIPTFHRKTVEEIIQSKVQYLAAEVKFKLKFQIAPLRNIHCYKHIATVAKFMQQQIGLQVEIINDHQELIKNYFGPVYQCFIQSRLVVCRVADFVDQILPLVKKYGDVNFKKIKYIIFDTQELIRLFISDQNNFCEEIAFVHYNLKYIQQYLEFWKTPVISIPFFAKGALSGFDQSAKQLYLSKNVNRMNVRSSVISTNQVLNQIFQNKVRISSEYQLSFFMFSANQRGIDQKQAFYEQIYLTNFSKLWINNYEIFKKVQGEYVYFQIIKRQIIFGLNRCKTYDLLNVANEDFKALYIDKIAECQSFIDLQISCIYILSLPHGFANILEQIFYRPRKYQLLTKIFCNYILILSTTFCSLNQESIQQVELINYLVSDDQGKKLQGLKSGDTVYNGGFVFCRQNNQQSQNVMKNKIIFQFENIQFLQKSRIRNNLYIEPFSFYKQGAQYIIPPQTKFMVKSNKLNEQGYYEIRLREVQNIQNKNLIDKILENNGLNEDILTQVFAEELRCYNMAYDMKKKVKKYSKEPSLYKKAELMNLLNSKKQLIISYQKGIMNNDYFFYLKNKMYFSALTTIYYRVAQFKQIQDKTGVTNLQMKRNEKMLQIEKALIYFKISEYKLSIDILKKLKESFLSQDGLSEKDWIISTLDRFIYSVEDTFINRIKVLDNKQKKKKWKVKASIQDNSINFKIKSKSQKWKAQYIEPVQKFCLTSENNLQQSLVAAQPENQFGSLVLAWINLEEHHILKAHHGEIINNGSQIKEEHNKHYIAKPSKKQTKKGKNDSTNENIFCNLFDEQTQETKAKKQKMLGRSDKNNPKKKQQAPKDETYSKKQENINSKNLNEYKKRQNPQYNIKPLIIDDKYEEKLYEIQEDKDYDATLQWQVFHLGEQVKLVQKKKHFHARLKQEKKANLQKNNFMID